MDGVADETDVIKTAMSFGMNAVAITDHNGVQGFPHVFNMVTDYNKKLLQFLEKIGFISSFKEHNNLYQVNTKNN